MPTQPDNHPETNPPAAPRRKRVLKPGTIPRARFVADLCDQIKSKAPALFERLDGKSRRTGGDPDDLVAGLAQLLRDADVGIRASAAQMLGRLGQAARGYSGDLEAATATAMSALTSALADADANVREAALRALAEFAEVATPALVDRVGRVCEDPEPAVRQAGIETLSTFGSTVPLPVVAALLRTMKGAGGQDDQLMLMAIEGLRDCGQNASSEAVEPLAAIVCDPGFPAEVRATACGVLRWLGPESRPVGPVLANVVVGAGGAPADRAVRVEAALALIDSADLPELVAGLVNDADKRREVLAVLREAGPEAAAARQALQEKWAQGEPAPGPAAVAPANDRPADVEAGLQADRLEAIESALVQIQKRLESTPAPSKEKEWYSVEEAAELTRLKPWTVRDACNKGRIAAEKSPDRRWRISREEVEKIQNHGLPKQAGSE